MHTIAFEKIQQALRNELAKWRTRGRFFLFLITPRGSGISKRTLDLAIYFAFVLASTNDAIRIQFGWSWWSELALWCYIILALIVASYIAGGIASAQADARELRFELERLKRQPAREIVMLTHRVDAIEASRKDIATVLDFVERWNKQDAEKDVAEAAQRLAGIIPDHGTA